MYSLGIDVGSSSVKVSLLDIESGKCVCSSTNPKVEAPIIAEQKGWAEQDPDAILAAVEQHAAQTYGTASMGQYADPANPLNRFVAYHLLDGAMAWNKLVMHMNEFGYEYGADMTDPQLNTFTVDVSHYYTTKGRTRCLLKVTQNGNLEDGVYPIYLNTARTYDTRPDGNYEVTAITSRGQKLSPTNGAHVNSAVNGFY